VRRVFAGFLSPMAAAAGAGASTRGVSRVAAFSFSAAASARLTSWVVAKFWEDAPGCAARSGWPAAGCCRVVSGMWLACCPLVAEGPGPAADAPLGSSMMTLVTMSSAGDDDVRCGLGTVTREEGPVCLDALILMSCCCAMAACCNRLVRCMDS
jgi:hypothetical protein